MAIVKPLVDNEKFLNDLKESAETLVDNLQDNDLEQATSVIQKIVEAKDSHLFQAVGQLTRGLHDAIVHFHVDEKSANPADAKISDASDRLQYVIRLTQEAADKTMDRVEEAAPIAMNLGQEANDLREEWNKLGRKELAKGDFVKLYGRMDEFLEKMSSGAEDINVKLQEIILEQGFQDLTGQVLKKMITLITDVESELVGLMRIVGKVEKITGQETKRDVISNDGHEGPNIKGEGPQIDAENKDNVVNGQDDVDDLLSSLGF